MNNTPTDAEIIALADETRTGEPGREGYILPISFARAVLARWGQPSGAVPLTDEQSHALLHRMADESDKWAEGLSYEPTREQVSGWCVAFLMRELPAPGIKKGGQHGTE